MKKILYGKEFETIDLSEIGINNYTFDLITTIQFLTESVKNDDRILGGEIIFFKNGSFCVSYDNWYCKGKSPRVTYDESIKYLKKYLKVNPLVNWVVAITTEKY